MSGVMDNLTHSLAGWALGQTGLKRKTRKGLAALVLGANMPDIDVFFGWVSWIPLATHRGFTHGLIGGVLLMPPLLAGLLWLLDRWQQDRGTAFRSGLPLHIGWLLALCYIGALTHPLLDMQTSYAIQLLSPFSTRWFHTETLFIIDVWIWIMLGLGIWLSRRREARGGAWQSPAIAAVIALCLYIGLNGGITASARHALEGRHSELDPDVMLANSEPLLFWRRSLVWRKQGLIGQASYDPLRTPALIDDAIPPVPDHMDDPIVRHVMRTDKSLGSFLRWSIMPLAQVERQRCEMVVILGDARFGVPAQASRLSQTVRVPTGAPGCPQ